MESLYDKIGDVLKETLSNGEIPDQYKNYKNISETKLADEGKKSSSETSSEKNNNLHPEADSARTSKLIYSDDFYNNIYKIIPELKILSLQPDVISKEILKEHYHKALKQVHPDTNKNFLAKHKESALKIKEIKGAYKKIFEFIKYYEN